MTQLRLALLASTAIIISGSLPTPPAFAEPGAIRLAQFSQQPNENQQKKGPPPGAAPQQQQQQKAAPPPPPQQQQQQPQPRLAPPPPPPAPPKAAPPPPPPPPPPPAMQRPSPPPPSGFQRPAPPPPPPPAAQKQPPAPPPASAPQTAPPQGGGRPPGPPSGGGFSNQPAPPAPPAAQKQAPPPPPPAPPAAQKQPPAPPPVAAPQAAPPQGGPAGRPPGPPPGGGFSNQPGQTAPQPPVPAPAPQGSPPPQGTAPQGAPPQQGGPAGRPPGPPAGGGFSNQPGQPTPQPAPPSQGSPPPGGGQFSPPPGQQGRPGGPAPGPATEKRPPPPTINAPLPSLAPVTMPPGAKGPPPQLRPIPLGAPQGPQRIDDFRGERREFQENGRTVFREPGRIIIRDPGGQAFIRHDEIDRFRYGARDVQIGRMGNNLRTVVIRPDGSQIVTITAPDGRLLRRIRRGIDGREIIIIDNGFPPPRPRPGMALGVGGFFVTLPPPMIRIPQERYIVEAQYAPPEMIYETLMAPPVERIDRRYTLDEIRYSPSVRDRMPRVDLDTINFVTGSWEVVPDQAEKLRVIADGINRAISANPREVFLIEGHTDAVGSDIDNLSLSDRRAESVAQILTEQFQVPAENLTSQGYGEQYLKVPTQGPEVQNRRVTIRRITPLLNGQSATVAPPPPGIRPR